jgi:uncharacterized protein YcgL (UPF0745 family)
MTKLLCNIYKSRRKEGTYLYVSLQDDLKRVKHNNFVIRALAISL